MFASFNRAIIYTCWRLQEHVVSITDQTANMKWCMIIFRPRPYPKEALEKKWCDHLASRDTTGLFMLSGVRGGLLFFS